MLFLRSTVSIFLLLVLLCACGRSVDREAQRAQALLNEADLLIDGRMFTDAELKAKEALNKLDHVLQRDETHTDYRLLRIRALMTLFMSRNILTIEQAEIRPRSLVRFPEAEELSDYETTVRPAEQELKAVINGDTPLKFDQAAFAHSTLATIYRLNLNTVKESLWEYDKALKVYDKQLRKLHSEKKQIGSNRFAIMRLENQIRSLQQAKAEVLLLTEDWGTALEVLRKTMAGMDLLYFSVQFDLLEGEIADLENKLSLDESLAEGSRENKLLSSIQSSRQDRKLGQREKLGGKNPYQVELLLRRMQLDDIQNNLLYRIIALYHLEENERLEAARSTLRQYYPGLEAELIQLLKNHP